MSSETSRFGDVDRQAFAEVYRRYAGWFRLWVVKRYGLQDADELTQEAWLRLAPYQARGEVRNAKALLLRIAENLAAERFRRAQRFKQSTWQITSWSGDGVEGAAQSDELLLRDLIIGLPQPLRNRIVVGEMRDGSAALETLKSWNTGHPGGLSTIHANSAQDVLHRIEDLIAEVAAEPSRRAIGQAIDLIVHIRRTGTGRCLDEILAVEGFDEGGYRLVTLTAAPMP